MAAY
ncbi:0b7f5c92-eed2-4ffc-b424-0ba93f17d964 [Thermothielavioides terrestris]|jgi:hypothetical protein